jgi:hypothetical protein
LPTAALLDGDRTEGAVGVGDRVLVGVNGHQHHGEGAARELAGRRGAGEVLHGLDLGVAALLDVAALGGAALGLLDADPAGEAVRDQVDADQNASDADQDASDADGPALIEINSKLL